MWLRYNAISKLHAVISQKFMVVDGENNRSYETEGKDTEVYISRVVCENNRSYETEGKDTEGYIYGELFMRTIGVMKQKVKIMRDIYIYMERCL